VKTVTPHWLPTGWFQIGWSADFQPGDVKPLKYFGRDLVAFRAEEGDLHVLDAHCRHLGGHLGYGGRVEGSCVVCPFHGWHWDGDGRNRYIPYQPDRPNKARTLGTWPVCERDGIVYMWHDMSGGAPSWSVPSILEDVTTEFADRRFHPPASSARNLYKRLTLHPQFALENVADPVHFQYVHSTKGIPVMLELWERGELWFGKMGFGRGWREMEPDSRTGGDTLSNLAAGVGLIYSAQTGSRNTALLLATTPVDDSTSDMFQTAWLEQLPGDDVEGVLKSRIVEAISQLPRDIVIWEHQRYEDPPALATSEGKAFSMLRAWAARFYPESQSAPRVLTASAS
jgi:3-ketosteroid 9alpha-monooxygenase subunit A